MPVVGSSVAVFEPDEVGSVAVLFEPDEVGSDRADDPLDTGGLGVGAVMGSVVVELKENGGPVNVTELVGAVREIISHRCQR